MDAGQEQVEITKQVTKILIAAPIVSGAIIVAAPYAVVTSGVTVSARVVNGIVDYGSQVVGNYMSGKSGAEAWGM